MGTGLLVAGCSGSQQTTPTPTSPVSSWSSTFPTPTCAVTVPVGKAVQPVVDANPGRVVCLGAGVHDLSSPITLHEGQTLAGTGGAVLRGSVPLSGWRKTGGVWRAHHSLAALDAAAQCEDNTANTCRVTNRVFVDDRELRTVPSGQQLAAGTAHVDQATGTVEVAVDPSRHEIRLSSTQRAVVSTARDVVVENLAVRAFATPAQLGAVEVGSASRVSGVHVVGVHGVAIKLTGGDDSVLADNTVEANGQLGLGVYQSHRVVVARNTVTGNNTDGFWQADWESGGIKLTQSSGLVQGNVVSANQGVGVWVDLHCDGVDIVGNRVQDSAADGIRFEISRNGRILQNQVTGNGSGRGRGTSQTLWGGGSVTVNTSSGVTISGNTFRENANGPSLQLRNRGSDSALRNVRVERNTIDMEHGSFGVVGDNQLASRLGVTFSGNTYLTSLAQPAVWMGRKLTLDQWQATHETDLEHR